MLLLKNKASNEAFKHSSKVIGNAKDKADFRQNQSKINYETNSVISMPA